MRNLRFLGTNLVGFLGRRAAVVNGGNNVVSRSFCTPSNTNNVRKIRMESENRYIYENVLPYEIEEKKISSSSDWLRVREKLLASDRQITSINIDWMVFNYCITRQMYDLAYSYIEFMKDHNIKPNISILSKYFKLFYLTNKDNFVDTNAEENILGLYRQLKSKYRVFDAYVGENIILALSLTTHWEECLKLLEELKALSPPTTKSYVALAASAFKNREYSLGWELLETVVERNNFDGSIAFVKYLDHIQDMVDTEDAFVGLEKLFDFFRVYNLKSDSHLTEEIRKTCRIAHLDACISTVSNRGICSSCNEKLQNFNLDMRQFTELKDTILKDCIIGKDVFRRSDPEELEEFETFIADMKRYDVVIDGLNVAYSSGTKKSLHVYSLLLSIMVKHFVDQKKNILVLGRQHMKTWPKRNWDYITYNTDVFLAKSISHDDPFLLYCALHSGLNTKIVSNDLMRSHIFKLQDPQKKLHFGFWLLQNQLQYKYINTRTGAVHFKRILPYMQTSQKQKHHWHIPCEKGDALEDQWICVEVPLLSKL